jgi:hypothetical protein
MKGLILWIVIPIAGWFLLTEGVFRGVDRFQAYQTARAFDH